MERWPEFHRPLPVDNLFAEPARAPTIPEGVGPQARAHVGILEEHRGDLGLIAYERSRWQVLKNSWRTMLMRAALGQPGVGGTLTHAYTDEGGTARTLGLFRPSANAATLWNVSNLFTAADSKLKWGSNAAAPTGADNDLGTPLDSFTGTLSLLGSKVRSKGSKIWAGANDTVREVGLFQRYNVDVAGPTAPFFLVDHAAIGGLTLNTNQRISITYDMQF